MSVPLTQACVFGQSGSPEPCSANHFSFCCCEAVDVRRSSPCGAVLGKPAMLQCRHRRRQGALVLGSRKSTAAPRDRFCGGPVSCCSPALGGVPAELAGPVQDAAPPVGQQAAGRPSAPCNTRGYHSPQHRCQATRSCTIVLNNC